MGGPRAIPIQSDGEFLSLLKALSSDIVAAHIHWRMSKDLRRLLQDFPDVAAEAQTFWSFTLKAHQRTALAALARAFDQESSSLHLRNWLLTIRTHMALFTPEALLDRCPDDPFAHMIASDAKPPDLAVLSADIEFCSMDDPDVKALAELRHSALAHRGGRLAAQGADARYPTLTDGQVETLLQRAIAIFNRYCMLFAAVGYGTVAFGQYDVEQVFQCVQRDLARQRADATAQAARRHGDP
ncbi:hypothetical protein [Metallibacterium scheffleri]|uniref:AbiU2 domain-containing protein n=1 Tax=Metallibacterium scheffleri TaxID=993689 RepID=UPI0023F4A03B|nr:hypothetical protein [Metallibacterium scheffleri]